MIEFVDTLYTINFPLKFYYLALLFLLIAAFPAKIYFRFSDNLFYVIIFASVIAIYAVFLNIYFAIIAFFTLSILLVNRLFKT